MPNYAIQEQNQDMVSLLAAQFRLLYNPAHALADVISMLQIFPGIAGIWAAGTTDANGRLIDKSGNGLHMTAVNTPQFGTASGLLAPFVRYSAASSQYHNVASAAGSTTDINGNEAYIRSEANGMTVIWIGSFTTIPASIFHLTSKSIAGANSWFLSKNASNNIQFTIFNSTALTTVTGSTTVVTGQQYIIIARFDPSTGLYLRVNSVEDENTTSIPATIDSTSTALTIGARATPEAYHDGAWSLAALSAEFVPDKVADIFYQMTAPLFGISI